MKRKNVSKDCSVPNILATRLRTDKRNKGGSRKSQLGDYHNITREIFNGLDYYKGSRGRKRDGVVNFVGGVNRIC